MEHWSFLVAIVSISFVFRCSLNQSPRRKDAVTTAYVLTALLNHEHLSTRCLTWPSIPFYSLYMCIMSLFFVSLSLLFGAYQ